MRSLRKAKESRNKGAALRCAVIVFLIGTLLMISGISTIRVRAQTQQANGKFRRVENAIPNQYIVVLNDDTPRSDVDIRSVQMVRSIGATLGHVYRFTIKGFSANMPEAAAIALSRDSQVEFVEEDARGTVDTTQTNPPWGLDRIDQTGSLTQFPLDHSYTYNETGVGVTAYVIDTGVRITHQDFEGRASLGVDCTVVDANGNCIGTGTDCFGHGTSVAALVGGKTYGVAKATAIINVRVCDCSASCPASVAIQGVDWVTGHASRPAVANISLRIPADGSAFDKAVRKSVAAGITYVVSAGNLNSDAGIQTPARITQCLTVGATGNDAFGADPVSDQRASFSNFGSVLDLFAPGVKTPSASPFSDTLTDPDFGGTSASSPHVAGAVARYLQTDPTACPSTASDVITSVATSGVVGNPGSGSPNKLLFTPLSWPSPTYYSLSLNGTSGYVDVADGGLGVKLDITGAITLEAWVFINTIVEQTIVRKGGITDGGYALKLMGSGKVRFITYASPSSQENVTSNTALTTGATSGWHHVAAVFDGTQKRIYLDGMLDKSQSSTFAPGSGTGHLSIGAAPDGTQPFSGLIDEVRLTADVVYTGSSFAPAHRLTGISGTRGLWRFDRQNAKDCADINNGTLVGAATFSTSVP